MELKQKNVRQRRVCMNGFAYSACCINAKIKNVEGKTRGGVLEDVLGLKDTFWSPWPWSLKSSKIALSSARGQHYFWTVEISLENARNLTENLQRPCFWFPQVEIAWNEIFEDLLRLKKILKTFFFWEHLRLCPRSLVSRESDLGLEIFCVLGLGLELCVLNSTSGQDHQYKLCDRQHLNCRGDASPHRELASPHRDFSAGWSDETCTNKSPIPAEYSTKLQWRPFFFFWSSLDFGDQNPLIFGETFFGLQSNPGTEFEPES